MPKPIFKQKLSDVPILRARELVQITNPHISAFVTKDGLSGEECQDRVHGIAVYAFAQLDLARIILHLPEEKWRENVPAYMDAGLQLVQDMIDDGSLVMMRIQ